MSDKEMSRRQLMRFLGLELPLVLISTQMLTRNAFGQPYTRKTFKVDREIFLDLMNDPAAFVDFTPAYDARNAARGGTLRGLSRNISERTGPKGMSLEGAVILAVGGERFDATSPGNITATIARMKQLVGDSVPLVIDLEIEGRQFQYVLEYK